MADSSLLTIDNTPPNNLPDSLDGKVLTVIHGDLGNAITSYFYFDLVKVGLNIFSLQFIIEATTLTIEATNDLPSIANADANWLDITDVLTDGVAVNFTATGSLSRNAPILWSRFRIKRVTTNATNALILVLTRGRVR